MADAKTPEEKADEARAAEAAKASKEVTKAQREALSEPATEQPMAPMGPTGNNPKRPNAVAGGALDLGGEYVTPGKAPRRAKLFFGADATLHAYDPQVQVPQPIEPSTFSEITARGGRTR